MSETLCWKCSNTCGGCLWTKSYKPVKGWEAKKVIINDSKSSYKSYVVKSCPLFKSLVDKELKTRIDKEVLYKFTKYRTHLTASEIKLMETILRKPCKEASILLKISERSLFRRFNDIKQKLKCLEVKDEVGLL